MFRRFERLMEEAGDNGTGGGTGQNDNNNQNADSGNQGGDDSGNQADDNSGDDGKGDSGNDLSSLPEWAQKSIKDLRAENAKTRTDKNNLSSRLEKIEGGLKSMFGEGEGDDMTPEQQVEALSSENGTLQFQQAVLSAAYESGVPMENYDYFSFLVEQKVNSLEEGQELTEEEMDEIVQKSKGVNGGNNNNSSVDGNGDDNKNPKGNGSVSLEQFVAMNMMEKSALFQKQPDLYNSLFKQAKEKRLLT